jgi:putative FmdB family regulatory protein
MPIYEYHCERCDRKFEVMQKFSDEPLTTHEGCGGAVEKLISSSAFQLKGSGWYVTDYGRKGSGSSNGKDESGKSEAGKSEAKPESKTESKSESSSTESKSTPAKSETSTTKSDTK